MKILVVEDEEEVLEFVLKGLVKQGHEVLSAINGREALEKISEQGFDVIVLDRMMPYIDGLEVLSKMRESGNETPVLILSALDKVSERVEGLIAGSDDYLVKPFDLSELIARVEILGKRSTKQNTILEANDLTMDLISRKVVRANKIITLQPREFKLLEYLIRNKGSLVTRTMILENVWEYNFDPQTNIIDVHMSRLREKIDNEFDEKIIKTVRGKGYIV
jgi:two-component system OmpR family response regulator